MAIKLADAFVPITGDNSPLRRSLRESRSLITGFISNITQGIGQGIGQAISNSIGNAFRAAFGEVGKATASARNLNETISRTNAVYGENAKQVIAWSQTTARSLGLAQSSALEATGTFGNMFLQLGFAGDTSVEFSQSLVEAAADITAFHNVSEGIPSVLADMASAFRGEFDPIQKFVPLINAAVVQQKALAQTGKESADSLTAGEKAAATYTLIMEGMGAAVGANARELDSAASQQRIFNARIEEGRAAIGQIGVVIQQSFFKNLNELLESMGVYGENIVDQLALGMVKGLRFIAPILQQMRAVFVRLLKPGSPPKLLPELNDWGQAAAEEYLKGWSMADATSLMALGQTIENALRSFASVGAIQETDLVTRIFGSQRALVDAINDWRAVGSISAQSMDRLRASVGPAADGVQELVKSYFDLQDSAKRAQQAQDQLSNVTKKYDDILSPLEKKLDDIVDAQREISDEQRLGELGKIIADPLADLQDRSAARLEQEEIILRQQIDAIGEERQAAVSAEEERLSAMELEKQAREQAFLLQEATIQQQIESNRLASEENDLKDRLANELLAEEEKRRRELEAIREKELADLERNEDAHLRYLLAIGTEEEQLALLQAELAKTTKGSAEYWNILTEIAQVQERIASRDADGGTDVPTIIKAIGDEATKQSPALEELAREMDEIFGIIFGTGDQEPVELSPFWDDVAEKIEMLGEVAGTVWDVLTDFFTWLSGSGGDAGSMGDVNRPTYNSGIFGQVYTAVSNIVTFLRRVFTFDWQPIWDDFKAYVTSLWENADEGSNPLGWTVLDWIVNEFIPAAESLARGEWADTWQLFADLAMAPFIALDEFLKEQGFGPQNGEPVGIAPDPNAPEWKSPNEAENVFKGIIDNFLAYLEEARAALRGSFPDASDLPIQPQSYNGQFPQGTPMGATAMAPTVPISLNFYGNVTPETLATAVDIVDGKMRSMGYSPST